MRVGRRWPPKTSFKRGKRSRLTGLSPRHFSTGNRDSLQLIQRLKFFLKELLEPTAVLKGEEKFFDRLGDIFVSALRVEEPLYNTAPIGLGILSSICHSVNNSEASCESDGSADAIFKRAILSEAALRAVIKTDLKVLKKEGFFDKVKKVVQEIGRNVMDNDEFVFKATKQRVVELLEGKNLSPPVPSLLQSMASFAFFSVDLPPAPATSTIDINKKGNTVLDKLLKDFNEQVSLDGLAVEKCQDTEDDS